MTIHAHGEIPFAIACTIPALIGLIGIIRVLVGAWMDCRDAQRAARSGEC
jgi:hypothetical protein